MNTPKLDENRDDSVICLDSSVEMGEIEDDIEDVFSESDFIVNKTLPAGVAPDGFIILDESDDTVSKSKESETQSQSEPLSVNESEVTPIFTVTFRDETVAREYRKTIQAFLQRLVPSVSNCDDEDDCTGLVLKIWSRKATKRCYKETATDNNDMEIISEQLRDDGDDYCNALFTIDKKPVLQDCLDIPTYGKRFEHITNTLGETPSKEGNDKESRGPKMNCWNCLGNHGIRDCPVSRNPMEIAKNRKEFQTRSGPKNNRYHVDNEQRFGYIVPGKISSNLKRALGIRENELPNHIYRMRMLGYPPGWLKEAKLRHSGMNLYDSDGQRELDPLEEPGQVSTLGDKDQYDVNKIHDFPGFNVPSPAGTKEMQAAWWTSRHYLSQSKETMLAGISERTVDGYQRRKLKRTVNTDIPTIDQNSKDMEIDEGNDDGEESPLNGEFVPPLPKSPSRQPTPTGDTADSPIYSSPKAVNIDLEALNSSVNADSPSLADLELHKRRLLEALDDSSTLSEDQTTPITTQPINNSSQEAQSEESILTPENEIPIINSLITTPSRGTVKSVALGTPIIESTSPYNKLPSPDKFSKNVCDIINFENLPDSTGKYKTMTGILQKVRDTLANNQQD